MTSSMDLKAKFLAFYYGCGPIQRGALVEAMLHRLTPREIREIMSEVRKGEDRPGEIVSKLRKDNTCPTGK